MCVILLLALVPVISACGEEETTPAPTVTTTATATATVTATPTTPAEPIVHKAVGSVDAGVPPYWPFEVLMNAVNEGMAGEYEIRFIGGRSVIPQEQQHLALQAGLFDMGFQSKGHMGATFPGINLTDVSDLNNVNARATGAWDLLNDIAMENGFYYLGGSSSEVNYIRTAVFPPGVNVTKLSDFQGLSSGASTPAYKPYADALGMSFTTIPGDETYSIIERKFVDVLLEGIDAAAYYKVPEVAGSVLDHFWANAGLGTLLYNLDSWNEMGKDLQDKFWDIMIENEPAMAERHTFLLDNYGRQNFVDAGVPMIVLPGDEGPTLINMMHTTIVTDVLEEFPDMESTWINYLELSNPGLLDYLRQTGIIQ
jgi:TRAP-type C4-dicarboxylate transport system substrate-binding protein